VYHFLGRQAQGLWMPVKFLENAASRVEEARIGNYAIRRRTHLRFRWRISIMISL
jgi:hypothetical protein